MNTPSQNVPDGEFDVLIFTSPMNVQTWFDQRKYLGEKIMAIGNTTAFKLYEIGIKAVITAAESSEKGIAKTLSTLI